MALINLSEGLLARSLGAAAFTVSTRFPVQSPVTIGDASYSERNDYTHLQGANNTTIQRASKSSGPRVIRPLQPNGADLHSALFDDGRKALSRLPEKYDSAVIVLGRLNDQNYMCVVCNNGKDPDKRDTQFSISFPISANDASALEKAGPFRLNVFREIGRVSQELQCIVPDKPLQVQIISQTYEPHVPPALAPATPAPPAPALDSASFDPPREKGLLAKLFGFGRRG